MPSPDRFMLLSSSNTVSAILIPSDKADHILFESLLFLLQCHHDSLEFWRQTAHAGLELCGILSASVRSLPLTRSPNVRPLSTLRDDLV